MNESDVPPHVHVCRNCGVGLECNETDCNEERAVEMITEACEQSDELYARMS